MNFPVPSPNIYPKTKRNLKALLDYYFETHSPEDIEWLKGLSLTLNQIEYIASLVKKHLDYFKKELNHVGLTTQNLMSYGIDALTQNEQDWEGAKGKNRNRITKGFFALVQNTS